MCLERYIHRWIVHRFLPSNLGYYTLGVCSYQELADFVHQKHSDCKRDWNEPKLERNRCSLENVVEERNVEDNEDDANADAHGNWEAQVSARSPERILLQERESSGS